MIKKIISYSFIISLSLILSPLFSNAQVGDLPPDSSGLQMTMTPENPEPFQLVKINVQSYSYDLDRSKITWYVDGVVKKSEMGLKDFNTQAGKNGQKTIVKIQVETPEDGLKEIEAFFIPSIVDLVYESLSYTPPFYKGRAMNPNQGVVLVTAIPELIKSTGEKIPAQNIIYSWKKDGSVEQDASGIGKNVFIYSGTVPIRDVVIEVVASSLDGEIYASKRISITNVSPKIIFYENSPVYGIMMNKAIKNSVNMLIDEFSVLAVPYFFSVGYAATPDLKYDWTLNGSTVGNQDPKNSFTTRLEKSGSGIANIGLKISNNVRIFQFVNNNYSINFSKE
jgi:hypothetical protein